MRQVSERVPVARDALAFTNQQRIEIARHATQLARITTAQDIAAALLHGFRGAPACDVVAVAAIIARLGALLRGEPSIREIDLNPVVVYPVDEGAMALDALVVVG